jgi:hypothetical protein
MSLSVLSIEKGLARLGSWGNLALTGRSTAVLKPSRADDVVLPEAVAEDLTAGVLLLNEETGGLLFLPYAGDLIISYDLTHGTLAYEPLVLPRASDRGLRMATVRLVAGFGAVYLTESTIAGFHEDCTLAWREDGDFAGWEIERITNDEVLLLRGDWAGNEERRRRALAS